MRDYSEKFEKEAQEISKLIETPELMQSLVLNCLNSLKGLNEAAQIKVEHAKSAIKNIQKDSLLKNYQIIYNQMCVLATSSFSAILEECFVNYVNSNWKNINFYYNKKEVKLDAVDLFNYGFNIKSIPGRILVDFDREINFQNLDSIIKTLQGYCGKSLKVKENEQKLIKFYLQCRHSIVHDGAEVSDEFMTNTAGCNIKDYQLNEKIILDGKDWESIKGVFCNLIINVQNCLRSK